VLALIAAAADPSLRAADVDAIQNAYFPWIGSLHTLLDSLIDLREDTNTGQQSLLNYYSSTQEMTTRIQMLAAESVRQARALTQHNQHLLILTAMVSQYLTDPKASSPDQLSVVHSILEEMGALAKPAMLILSARHATNRILNTHMNSRIGSY
jgi:tetraprenyl-beta-curcumene synthase